MKEKVIDWVFKILAVLVIPVMGWGISLHTKVAVLQNELDTVKAQIVKAEDTAKEIAMGVNDNKVTLGQIKGQLSGIETSIGDIKGLLNNLR